MIKSVTQDLGAKVEICGTFIHNYCLEHQNRRSTQLLLFNCVHSSRNTNIVNAFLQKLDNGLPAFGSVESSWDRYSLDARDSCLCYCLNLLLLFGCPLA
jgi:hypothetical protein